MDPAFVPQRLSSAIRRESILNAAQRVFAETGFEGARMQYIADAAKISEALIFRYFPTKRILYKAVLTRVVATQDARYKSFFAAPPGADTLIAAISAFINSCDSGIMPPRAHSARLLLRSLAGDTAYARLVYRRSKKLWAGTFAQNIAAAIQNGDATETTLNSVNAYAFIEHVGTMMLSISSNKSTAAHPKRAQKQLESDAVWFVCRGIGITDDALHRHFSRAKQNRFSPR